MAGDVCSATRIPSCHSSFRTSLLPPNPSPLHQFSQFTTPRPSNTVRCVVHSNNRAERSKQREAELFEQYGLNPADWTPRIAKSRKGSKERHKQEKGISSASDATEVPRSTHRMLQIIRGKARGRKLLSPTGMDVRPMMEVVRGASFDILQVAGGCPTSLRPGRWLDLYSGTGSVGIEAISRGCSEVHFVEMDPWVVEQVLRPNLEHTGFCEQSVIHMVRVETFLKQYEKSNYKLGYFDYVSVTPPYESVDYGSLMDQLSRSPLVGKDAFILVEYPSKTSIIDRCGFLMKLKGKGFLKVLWPSGSKNKGVVSVKRKDTGRLYNHQHQE